MFCDLREGLLCGCFICGLKKKQSTTASFLNQIWPSLQHRERFWQQKLHHNTGKKSVTEIFPMCSCFKMRSNQSFFQPAHRSLIIHGPARVMVNNISTRSDNSGMQNVTLAKKGPYFLKNQYFQFSLPSAQFWSIPAARSPEVHTPFSSVSKTIDC